MPSITFEGNTYQCQPAESVLDILLRHKVEAAFSCRAGSCQTCLLHCLEGEVQAAAQKDLKPALKDLNYFLACQCIPQGDLQIAAPTAADVYSQARLTEKIQLSATVWRLRLMPEQSLLFQAGQFLNVRSPQGWVRSYSLANLPASDQGLELHVRVLPQGKMSHWLTADCGAGEMLEISTAHGHCIYTAGEPQQPLLLVATGTGLAPIVGILRAALAQGHSGPVRLYHGVREAADLYLHKTLQALAGEYANLHYYGCVSGADTAGIEPGQDTQPGRAADLAFQHQPDLKGSRVYLCGSPKMVKQVRTRAYLAGASMADILVDAFTCAAPAPVQETVSL